MFHRYSWAAFREGVESTEDLTQCQLVISHLIACSMPAAVLLSSDMFLQHGFLYFTSVHNLPARDIPVVALDNDIVLR